MRRNLALDFGTDGYNRLDACCRVGEEFGTNRMADCVMNDITIDVRPMVVADFKALPYRDGVFDHIYFDPPHMIRNDKWTALYESSYRSFGNWKTRREWESALDAANGEFARVGTAACILHVKILDGPDPRVTKRADLNRLTRWRVGKEWREPPATPWSNAEVVFAEMLKA